MERLPSSKDNKDNISSDKNSKLTIQLSEEELQQFQLFLKQQRQQNSQSQASFNPNENNLRSLSNFNPEFAQAESTNNDITTLQSVQQRVDQKEKNFQFDWELPRDQWILENKIKQCNNCNRDFSVFTWKNHCRKCGRIFCSKCVNDRYFESDGSRILSNLTVQKRKQQNKEEFRATKICIVCEENIKIFDFGRQQKLNLINLKSTLNTNNKNGLASSSFLTVDSQSKIETLTDKKKTEEKDAQPAWMEGRNTNRLSQGFGLAAAVAASETTNSMRGETQQSSRSKVVSTSNYVKMIEAEELKIQNMAMNENQLVYDAYNHRLKEFSHRHISKVVTEQLLVNKLSVRKWHSLVYGFVLKAAENVRPSSRLLNDSLDINQYVKIKIIDWRDSTKSAYVNGIVMTKNLADRRMQNQIQKPSILILRNSLDIGSIEQRTTDLQRVIDEDEHLIKVLNLYLEKIKPSLIFVQGDVPYKVMCILRDKHNITVVSNLDERKITKLARMTQTIPAHGITNIDKNFALGKCKVFSVNNLTKTAKENGFLLATHRKQKIITSEDQYLMKIDGCNSALGCTVLISGPPDERDELRLLKSVMKGMLKLAKNIIQERNFLQMINIDVPALPPFDWVVQPESPEITSQQQTEFQEFMSKFEETDKKSPFLITHTIDNRTTLVYQEFLISLKTNQKLFSSDMEYIPEKEDQRITEKFIYNQIDKICGHPVKQKVVFYQENYDENGQPSESNDLTLGKYLEQILKKSKKQCMECSNQMSQHAVEVYHLNGNIRVTIQNSENPFDKKSAQTGKDQSPLRGLQQYNESADLLSGLQETPQIQFCTRCITCGLMHQKQNLPTQVYELSTARFIEQFFYNDRLQSRNQKCGHGKDLMKEFQLIFELNPMQKIVFEYKFVDVFKIKLVQPKKYSNKICLNTIVQVQREKFFFSITKILERVKELIRVSKQQIQQILEQKRTFGGRDQTLEVLAQKLESLDQINQKFDSYFCILVNDSMKEMTQLNNEVLSALFLKRKVFINLISFQRLFDEIIKQSALLIVLCRRRIAVLQFTNGIPEKRPNAAQAHNTNELDISILESGSIFIQENNFDDQVLQRESQVVDFAKDQQPISMHTLIHGSENEDSLQMSKSQQNMIQKKKFKVSQIEQQEALTQSNYTSQPPKIQFVSNTAIDAKAPLLKNNSGTNSPKGSSCFIELLFLPGVLTFPVIDISDPNRNTSKFFVQHNKKLRMTSFAQTSSFTHNDVSQSNFQNAFLPCPISQCDSQSCNNGWFIVQAYKQLCDEIQDQILIFHRGFSPNYTSLQDLTKLDLTNDGSIEIDRMPQLGQPVNHSTNQYQLENDASLYLNETVQTKKKTLSLSLIGQLNKQAKKESPELNFIQEIQEPTLTMPLGIDNNFIQIDPNDTASIIAFALNSNTYCEALGKLDYMNLADKIKKNRVKMGAKTELEQLILLDKEDVFNYEAVNRAAIEGEMLNSAKIEFKLRFQTHSKDVSCLIQNGSQDYEINTSNLHFKTGRSSQQQAGHQKSKKVLKDLQTSVLPSVNKEYLKNEQVRECLNSLESTFAETLNYFLDKKTQTQLQLHITALNSQQRNQSNNLMMAQDFQRNETSEEFEYAESDPVHKVSMSSRRETVTTENFLVSLQNIGLASGGSQNKQTRPQSVQKATKMAFNTLGLTQMTKNSGPLENIGPLLQQEVKLKIEPGTAFGVDSPSKQFFVEQTKGHLGLCEFLKIQKIDFQVKILYPKRFQALRRFYCGTHQDFIVSILKSETWATTGGKTKAQFFKSHDEKYVFKEVKKSEFKMFVDFGPAYFDYMCKAFFHDYPCALAKILGAYVVSVRHQDDSQNNSKMYILVLENLNLGIKPHEETHIVRYDLKGSELNRFVKEIHNASQGPSIVLQDSNFLLQMNGRPLIMEKKLANMLQICLNNDSLFLSKQNRIDYSLLTIIDKKNKRVRFGIIDYLQIYTFDRLIETTFKKVVNLGIRPTIIEPKAYRMRFTYFARLYLMGIHSQIEKKLPKNASGEDLRQSIALGKEELDQIEIEDNEVEQSYQGVFVVLGKDKQK